MKRAVPLFAVMCLTTLMAFAQPMSGTYTVGGTSPDFETLQDCAVALKQRGVSGPVFFNIRPGIYMRNGGNNSVLRLDTVVAGVSSTNRITFQPDAASGGNVDNVVLRFNRTDPLTADRDLVLIQLDFVTLRDLTLDDIDSSHTFDNHLIRLERLDNRNPVVDGFHLEACKLIGTLYMARTGAPLGTDFGIGSIQNLTDLIVRGNTFVRLLRAVSIVNGSAVAQTTIIIEDNHILEGYASSSGSGNFLGAGIEVSCTTAYVRRNIVDFRNSFNGGYKGINVNSPRYAVIEQNIVRGAASWGMFVTTFGGLPAADSVLIANNMIASGNRGLFGSAQSYGLISDAVRNARIVHNTIVVPSNPVNGTGLRVIGQNSVVLNNIVINNATAGFVVGYDLGGASAPPILRSDYNIIYKRPNVSGPIVIHHSNQYASFAAYQDSTGLDSNSISKEVDFLDVTTDLHLSDVRDKTLCLREYLSKTLPGILMEMSEVQPPRSEEQMRW